MLSRVAESIYWMCRYIERAENIARVVGVNANLWLDLPAASPPAGSRSSTRWTQTAAFEQRDRDYGERQVVRFLLGDHSSPSSVRTCLTNARENCRTVRDILPREAWQYLTELQMHVDENLNSGLTRSGRYAFLDRIVRDCQMTVGLLGSVMTRDVGYQFLRLGRNLERADMTTRFIDMRLSVSDPERLPDPDALDTVQWVNVLVSLSADQMYRRKMQARVQRPHVLWFLFKDDEFPRLVRALPERARREPGDAGQQPPVPACGEESGQGPGSHRCPRSRAGRTRRLRRTASSRSRHDS